MQKMGLGKIFLDLFFKKNKQEKFYMKQKQVISTLISIFQSLSMIFSETYFSRYSYSIK